MTVVKLIEVEDNIITLVAKAYDKNEEQLNEEVAQLKEWLKQQPHLPEVMDDKAIQNIYIGSKCRMKKAQQKLDTYYTIRTQKKEIFRHSNPKLPNVKLIMKAMYLTVLPKMTDDMYRVFMMKVRNKDLLNDLSPYCLIHQLVNLQEIRNHEDVTFGDVFIFDLESVTFRWCLKFTPMVLYNCVKIYERFFPIRLKAIYLLNVPFYGDKFLALVRFVMKPKLFERLHVCKNFESVFEQVPKKILPSDYGGEEKSMEELHEILTAKFVEYQERFDRLDQLRVDENVRPAKKS